MVFFLFFYVFDLEHMTYISSFKKGFGPQNPFDAVDPDACGPREVTLHLEKIIIMFYFCTVQSEVVFV